MADEMAGLRAAKKELRTLMRQKLWQLSTESIEQQSAAAVETLLALPEYKNARRIGIYLSMPKGELSTKDIVHDALRNDKMVFVPYIYKSNTQGSVKTRSLMNMVSLHSLSDYESLRPDAWGIPSVSENLVDDRFQVLRAQSEGVRKVSREKPSGGETSSSMESKGNERLDIIVMPGVAFDTNLRRLGHGKGYYDHFLDRYHCSMAAPMPFLIGLSLDIQLLPDGQSVPMNASDHKLNALIVGDGTVVRS